MGWKKTLIWQSVIMHPLTHPVMNKMVWHPCYFTSAASDTVAPVVAIWNDKYHVNRRQVCLHVQTVGDTPIFPGAIVQFCKRPSCYSAHRRIHQRESVCGGEARFISHIIFLRDGVKSLWFCQFCQLQHLILAPGLVLNVYICMYDI